MKITRFTAFIVLTAAVLLFFLISPRTSRAQGIDGLSQLLGGVGLGRNSNSGQPAATITVERNAPPYAGMFSGKETAGSETKSLEAKFQCFPAHDTAFDQTDTYVCYAAQ
jgi:hypothetical protein